MNTSVECNSRIDEFDFLISIMSDLAYNYKGHNIRLLEELIANLNYRRVNEKSTIISKALSNVKTK
jgi:hypothetical protein